jgi:hypothetical protein
MTGAQSMLRALEELNQSGSNVPQINNGDIAPLEIDVFSDAEQSEIARRVETALSWIDRLAFEASSARKLINHLDQAVLAKAFRGELVSRGFVVRVLRHNLRGLGDETSCRAIDRRTRRP